MKENLANKYSNFAWVSIVIACLQKYGIPLSKAIEIIQNVSVKFSQLTGPLELLLIQNYITVLSLNKGL